ncbi:hypothetical protein ACLB2K_053485 [Fragaria x ananassa]
MNTHFFHQTTTSNRRRNKILQIRDDNGNWITTEPEIVAHLTEYFQNMYIATDLSNVKEVLSFVENKVTPEINESLMLEVTMEEVKAAVFDLGALKASDPDGSLENGVSAKLGKDCYGLCLLSFYGFDHQRLPREEISAFTRVTPRDPLSPFLFLFTNDVLSSMINKMCDQNLLDAVRIMENGPLVSHLFFADDSLFFLKVSLYNCEALSNSLHLYCMASGHQSINVNKSSCYFNPNMKVVDDPGMYLGLATVWGRSKVAALKYVKEKINKRIVG